MHGKAGAERVDVETERGVIERVQDMVAASSRIVVLTGAGISTDAGIPDFRGPNGLWTKNPKAERMANINYYLNDPEVRELAWQSRLGSAAWEARPTAGHRAIVELHERGQLHAVITQNVDGLHQLAGLDDAQVIEVHGTMHYSRCWNCQERLPMADTLVRVRAGEADPECLRCRTNGLRGILKSDTISFGQSLIPEVIDRAFQVAKECDLLIAIGTTLAVGPVNRVVPEARRNGAGIVIVNQGSTEMDHLADEIVDAGISETLPVILSVGR